MVGKTVWNKAACVLVKYTLPSATGTHVWTPKGLAAKEGLRRVGEGRGR